MLKSFRNYLDMTVFQRLKSLTEGSDYSHEDDKPVVQH